MKYLINTGIMLFGLILIGCEPSSSKTTAAEEKSLLIADADIVTLNRNSMASGPIISGSIQPERQADLRAEVSSVVIKVYKDNGDKVKKGDLLVRLDDTAIRDALNSAKEANRASRRAYDQAQRQLKRLTKLSSSGAVSTQNLEDAQIRRNNAQSDLLATKTKVAQAQQQLERTEVRAPFDGVVSSREISSGDTVQVGRALLNVVDPASVRFEGYVSSDQGARIQQGLPVRFKISGYSKQEFTGKVERVNPVANAVTRQIAVIVAVAWVEVPAVAGLYAEGRVETSSRDAFMLPPSTITSKAGQSYVWRLEESQIKQVPVITGERDARTGRIEIISGIAAEDKLLRVPNDDLSDGTAFEMQVISSGNQARLSTP